MKLLIRSRSGRDLVPGGLDLSEQASVEDLKQAFYEVLRKYYPARQRFTLQPKAGNSRGVVLQPGKRLKDYDLNDGSVLLFKDLGPQVGYRTVFFWEYLGPLIMYALVYLLPQLAYPHFKSHPAKNHVQQMALAFWTFHYTKRILETFFLHKFSHATMPVANLLKNCTYYWGFATYISYFINHPLYTTPQPGLARNLLGLALVCELCNFWCHVILSNLRLSGSKEYHIPQGFLFSFITCPNYTTEILGWVLFALATSTAAAGIFAVVGGLQMAVWASAKHRRLRKMFDGKDGRAKYPRRWVMLPPIF